MKITLFNRNILLSLIFTGSYLVSHSQQSSMGLFGAGSFQRANMVNEEFVNVGPFKVKGNPYILKGANFCDIYTTLGKGTAMPIVFDANLQLVSVLHADRVKMADIKPEELDSFILRVTNEEIVLADTATVFVNADRIDSSKKGYFQRIVTGTNYDLYKSFKVELRPAAMDIAQTSLRQFEILSEYYYYDKKVPKKLVRIKNSKFVKKQFKEQLQALSLLEGEGTFEKRLKMFFIAINK